MVRSAWENQQAEVFADLKSRESGVVLAGVGRCDSPGHCATFCTYTLLDVKSKKVVDFKVVFVTEVANSNKIEKRDSLKRYHILRRMVLKWIPFQLIGTPKSRRR